MDIATIIGLVGGGLIVWHAVGANSAELYNGTALLVVVGGGIAATLVAFTLRDIWHALAATRNVLIVRTPDPPQIIERIVGYAETARREGILGLEEPIHAEQSRFLRGGMQLATDGTEPSLIMDILETELHFVEERHVHVHRLVERLGRHWGLFGLVGALLVLVQGGGVTAMAVPLLYGALLYGLIGGAFAQKLREYHDKENLSCRLVIEGVMAIQSGDNPRIIEHKLSVFIAPKDRPRGDRQPSPELPVQTPDISPNELTDFIDEHRQQVLTVVREEMGGSGINEEQQLEIEDRIARCEKGDLTMVQFLVGLGGGLYDKVIDCLQNPPEPLTSPMRPLEHELSFPSLTELTDQGIQVLMREIDQRDLAIALKGASQMVREKILSNMSDRVREFISEEIGYVQCERWQVLDAQARIIMQLYQLENQGKIQLQANKI